MTHTTQDCRNQQLQFLIFGMLKAELVINCNSNNTDSFPTIWLQVHKEACCDSSAFLYLWLSLSSSSFSMANHKSVLLMMPLVLFDVAFMMQKYVL